MPIPVNDRRPDQPLDPMFLDRWSPRAFSTEPIARETLDSLFEAARWAPSCFNEQPWVFLYATEDHDLNRFRGLLSERNRLWASRAPVLAFLFCRRTFSRSGKPNRWAMFDCGAAWMSLALQARRCGLYTHAMAGFKRQESYGALGVPEDEYEAICAIALGYYGDPAQLPLDVAAQESPSGRHPATVFARAGRF